MPSQPSPAVRIGSMRIRLPGTSAASGEALARALQEQLAGLPVGEPVHLGALNLRIRAPATTDPQALPGAIATSIARHLARPTNPPPHHA